MDTWFGFNDHGFLYAYANVATDDGVRRLTSRQRLDIQPFQRSANQRFTSLSASGFTVNLLMAYMLLPLIEHDSVSTERLH